MGENGDSVLKVVQLFIDNINESTRSTAKELDKLSAEVGDVKTKINTPPRNEELYGQVKCVEDKVDTINNSLITLINSIKSMITAVRVAVAVIGFAIILSAGIMHYGKYIESKSIKKMEQKLDKYLDETKQIKNEVGVEIE